MGIESKIEADLRAREAEEGFFHVNDVAHEPFDVPERGRVMWEVWLIALLVGAAILNAVLLLVGLD